MSQNYCGGGVTTTSTMLVETLQIIKMCVDSHRFADRYRWDSQIPARLQ